MMILGSIFVITSEDVKADPVTIYVPGDYSTIQGAIDAANDRDTIVVCPFLRRHNRRGGGARREGKVALREGFKSLHRGNRSDVSIL